MEFDDASKRQGLPLERGKTLIRLALLSMEERKRSPEANLFSQELRAELPPEQKIGISISPSPETLTWQVGSGTGISYRQAQPFK